MIKYFKNGVLEVETLDLPQDCGEIAVSVLLEEEREDANYYLEFACPRNVKYISQKLTRIAEKEYEIILPRGISEYIGEVYVQMLIMSSVDAVLISRSLIASNPLFVIKESILASSALDSSDRRDFFEYAQNVVTNVTNRIEVVDKMIEDVPSQITNIVKKQLEVVDDKMTDYQVVVDEKFEEIINSTEILISNINSKIDNNTSRIDENEYNVAEIQSNVIPNIDYLNNSVSEINSKVENVEKGLGEKLNITAVKNDFSSNVSDIYSSQYINNNLKKIHADKGEFVFTTSTSYSEVGTISAPANGYIIVYFGSCTSGATMSKVGILPVKTSSNTIGVVSNLSHTLSPASMGVVLCDYVESGTTIKLYCQCQTSGKKNTGYYRYILFED